MKSYHITTLNDFIIQKQKDFPYAKGELSSLLHHLGIAAKMVNKKINKAGLIDIKGGIFLYPENETAPKGKLRLVYECNPIAFIAAQAGGIASNGKFNILEITPVSLHQRSPFYAGSKNMVSKIESFLG